jgi:CRISPR-associated protein Csm2
MINTRNNPKSKAKSFSELGEEVKNRFFKNNYDELLNMSKTKSLDEILNKIEEFVKVEGSKLSTSQLRNIYDRSLKTESQNELKLIRPNLAYLAGRSSSYGEKSLLAFIDLLIKSVKSDEQVKEFKIFFEAVVAYHKFYGKQ